MCKTYREARHQGTAEIALLITAHILRKVLFKTVRHFN